MITFPKYEAYQDSGISWLGEVPAHWDLKKNKFLLTEKKSTVGKESADFTLLSLTLNGVIARDMENPQGKFPAEFNTYKIVDPNDLVFCLFDVEETPRTVGRANQRGMITGAYTVFECSEEVDSRFFYYYYLSLDFDKRLRPLYTGLRNVIKADAFLGTKSPIPPLEEQKRIVEFLDRKTAEIDEAIAHKQRLIELLQEQKAILINQAVTKGLNLDSPMKNSGVNWLGQLPKHWSVRRAKFLFTEVDERSQTGTEELLSVSHMTGVTPRSEKNVYMFMAEDYTGSKLCRKDDLVINIMWAWMGALGVSDRIGIVSPSYGIFRQIEPNIFNSWYLEHLLRSTEYVAQYNRISTGLHSSRLRLYAHMFLNMEILLPPKDEQDQIVSITLERAKSIDETMKSIESEMATLGEFRSILISKTITGKIKV